MGNLTGALVNPNGGGGPGILDTIKKSFSGTTLAGLISVGTSIGLDALGVPPILQNIIPGILNGLVVETAGNTGGGEPGTNLFGKMTDILSKFGRGLLSTGQQLVSFGSKVIEGVGTLTKTGFTKALDVFNGIFDRQTQETLIQAGNGNIARALENNCSVLRDGIHCAYRDIEIDYSSTSDQLSYSNRGTQRTFQGLSQVGNFFSGSIAFAEEADGIMIHGEKDSSNLDTYALKITSEEHPYSEFRLKVSDGEIKEFFETREMNVVTTLRAIGISEEKLIRAELQDTLQVIDHDVLSDAIDLTLVSKTTGKKISFDHLADLIEQNANQLKDTVERFINDARLLGLRSNSEITVHKTKELQKILDAPTEIYVIHSNGRGPLPSFIRNRTQVEGNGINVDHTALVFQNHQGQNYVIEFGFLDSKDSNLNTGLRVTSLDNFINKSLDIVVQLLPLDDIKKENLVDDILYRRYISEDMQPKIELKYDIWAAGKEAFNIPGNTPGNDLICSTFIQDIVEEVTGKKFTSLDADQYVSPTELMLLIKKWITENEN